MSEKNNPPVLQSELRTDSLPADEHYSSEGYFYDNPILTRTGIFVYHLEDGSERRELRRPQDVFDPESLASYEGKPIIITHDARVIDKDNARRERVGTILTPGTQDGETVRAKIVLDDPDAVKASGLRELSLGYYQNLIMEPGEWNGEPYDAIQTNIRVNHLALVAVARAGEDARLNMDSQDNGGVLMDENEKKATETMDNDTTVGNPDKPTEDDAGVPGPPAAPELNQAALEAAIKAYAAAISSGATADEEEDPADGSPVAEAGGESVSEPDALAEITARRDEMEDGQAKSDINTLLAMLEAANARADAAETDEEEPTSDGEDEQLNHDSADAIVEAKVRQRVELCRLGDRLNLDGMDSLPVMQAKKKIIKKVLPAMRLDGKSEAYIDAAYDIAREKTYGRKTVNDQRQQIFNADAANASVQRASKNDPDAARQKMINRHTGEKED